MADIFEIDDSRLSEDSKKRIQTSLSQNKGLKWFQLPNSAWVDDTVPALCRLLEENSELMYLLLTEARFTPEQTTSLCEALRGNSTLDALDLTNTTWSDASVEAFCRYISTNTSLEALQLQEAKFTPGDVVSLVSALSSNSTLVWLNLTNTTWSDASVDAFCRYISTNTSLVDLSLQEAKFTPGDVVSLVSALSSNSTLRTLDLRYSTWGEQSLSALCECLIHNTEVEAIDFTSSRFTNAGLGKMFGSLSKNTVLKYVQFANSSFTDVGATAVSEFFLKNTQLQDLQFDDSKFTDRGLADLMSSLSANTTLQQLNFARSELSDAAIPDLCKMLQHNNHIKRINFFRSEFTDAGFSVLMRTLARNRTLHILHIWGNLTDAVIADLCRFLDHNTTIQELEGDKDVTDVKLRWALQELLKLDNVQEATIDGESMELKVKLLGQSNPITISAAIDWERNLVSSGHLETPPIEEPQTDKVDLGDSHAQMEPLAQRDTDEGDVYTVQVADQRWVKVQKHGDGSATNVHISAWCPQDVLTTCNHLHDQKQTVEGTVEIDFNTSDDSWGFPQLELWTQEQWVPVLTSLLASPGKVTGLCVKAHNLLPINGLLRAAQGMLTPQHTLTGGMTVCGGQVSEDVLLTFLDVTHTVSLCVNLSDIVIVLRGGRGLADVQELATLIQQKVATDVQGRPGKVEHLTYVTPEGQVVHEDVDSEEERSGQQHKTRSIKVVVSERPWELEVLEPKYRRAYEIASRRGTQRVCKSRVMVVGHYGAGKTNLVRCLLDKDFESQHHTTIGIEADPGHAKIEITMTKGWTQHKEDTFESKMAKHLVNEANAQDPPSEADTPEQDISSNVALSQNTQTTALAEITEWKPSSSSRGPTKRSQRHHETLTGPSMQIKEEQRSKSTNKGIPLNIMEMIAKEEERRKEKMMQQTGESQELYFWDYAGQGVFYTTHQLFLSARSIYIVVLNLKEKMAATIPTYRKDLNGETVLDHSCPQTVQDYIQYWLSCIYTHVDSARRAAGMEATRWDPQVILALTHKDECSEDEVEEYKVDLEKFLHEKGYKFLIQDVLTISNRNREYNDVKNMKEALEKLGKERNYEVPLSWYKLKEGIMREDKKSLTLDDIRSIANKEDLQDLDETSIEAALSFLHEVGDVVYFKDGPLSDFIVKDVQWLVDQFKKVISITADHKNQPGYTENAEHWKNLNDCGILHQKLLESVWPEEDTRTKLLSLMLRFCLVMPAPNFYMQRKEDDTPDTCYLVPCLLPAGIPPTELETDHVVRLCPNLGFLPVGLVSRLLASLSVESKWRSDGRVYQNQGTFKPSQDHLGTITIRKRSADNEQSTHVEAIEVSVHQENQPMGDSTLKESFSVIAQALHNLPGKSDFGVWLCCETCKQWNFICNLEDSDDQSVCERSICEKHGPPLKQSEHAHWFCENIEDEALASVSQIVSAKHLGSEDRLNEEQVDDVWEEKTCEDDTRFLQLTSLLVFINIANEEELEETGLHGLEVLKMIIKEINTYPRWKIQGFLRIFPLGIQRLIKDHLGMHPLHSDVMTKREHVITPKQPSKEKRKDVTKTTHDQNIQHKDMPGELTHDDYSVQQTTSPHEDSQKHGRKQLEVEQQSVLRQDEEERRADQDVRQEEDKRREDQDVGHKKEKELLEEDVRQEREKEREEQVARQYREKERKEQDPSHEKEKNIVVEDVRQDEEMGKEETDTKDKEDEEREEQHSRQVEIEQHDSQKNEEKASEEHAVRQDEEKEKQDGKKEKEKDREDVRLQEGKMKERQYTMQEEEKEREKHEIRQGERKDREMPGTRKEEEKEREEQDFKEDEETMLEAVKREEQKEKEEQDVRQEDAKEKKGQDFRQPEEIEREVQSLRQAEGEGNEKKALGDRQKEDSNQKEQPFSHSLETEGEHKDKKNGARQHDSSLQDIRILLPDHTTHSQEDSPKKVEFYKTKDQMLQSWCPLMLYHLGRLSLLVYPFTQTSWTIMNGFRQTRSTSWVL